MRIYSMFYHVVEPAWKVQFRGRNKLRKWNDQWTYRLALKNEDVNILQIIK